MKIKNHDNELSLKLTIEFENEDEVLDMWHRLNIPIIDVNDSSGDADYRFTDNDDGGTFDLWHKFNDYLEENYDND